MVKTKIGSIQFMAASEDDLIIGDEVALLSNCSQAPYVVTKQSNKS